MTDTTKQYFDLNPWQWWQDKRAGLPVQANPDNPQLGFFRMPHKWQYGARKTFTPVAFYPSENGEIRCRVGDEDVPAQRAKEVWNWVCNHDVAEEAYREVAERGGLWPDEHPDVGMGHNRPPEDLSTFEALRDKIEDLAREAAERIEGPPIADQDECDRVANLADRLAELNKILEERYKEERKPHDEALKELRAKWGSLQLKAETYKNLKYKLLTPWLKQVEAAAKAKAEEAARAGSTSEAEPRRARAGTRGKAMTLRSTKRAEIVEYAAALEFFKDSPDVVATVQLLADRAVRAGISVPGTKVIEEEKAV